MNLCANFSTERLYRRRRFAQSPSDLLSLVPRCCSRSRSSYRCTLRPHGSGSPACTFAPIAHAELAENGDIDVSKFWRGLLEARTTPLGIWIGRYRLLLLSFKSWLSRRVSIRSVLIADHVRFDRVIPTIYRCSDAQHRITLVTLYGRKRVFYQTSNAQSAKRTDPNIKVLYTNSVAALAFNHQSRNSLIELLPFRSS